MIYKRNLVFSLALLAMLVLLVRLTFFLVAHDPDSQFFQPLEIDYWLNIARNLVDYGSYSLVDADLPTAKRGPTVVYFFAMIVWLFGDSVWPILIAQWLTDVGTCILLFFIALEVFRNRQVAFVSSLLFAFYIPGIIFTLRAWSEPLFTLVLAGFTLSFLRALRQPSIWRFALSGGLLGLATLARPNMLFYPLVTLPVIFWALDGRWRQVFSGFVALFVTFTIALSPWVVRNYLLFQAFIPASSLGGQGLHRGALPLREPNYLRERGVRWEAWHLLQILETRFGPAPADASDLSAYFKTKGMEEEAELSAYLKTKGLNEYQADQIAQQEGIKLIRAYPGRYIILSLVRFFQLWFNLGYGHGPPSILSILLAITNGILFGLAGAAFVFFRGAWLRPAVPLVVLVAFNTAFYIAILSGVRFSMPVVPYVMLFAAHAIVCLWPGISRIQQTMVWKQGSSY